MCIRDSITVAHSTIPNTVTAAKTEISESRAITLETDLGATVNNSLSSISFAVNNAVVESGSSATSLITYDSGIAQGDTLLLSTTATDLHEVTAGITVVTIVGSDVVYTTDISHASLGTTPLHCGTGSAKLHTSVSDTQGVTNYTTETDVERILRYYKDTGIIENVEYVYRNREVSGRYVTHKIILKDFPIVYKLFGEWY